jgi:hypothetical protein
MNMKSNWLTQGVGSMRRRMVMSGFPSVSILTGAPITMDVGCGIQLSVGCGFPMILGAGQLTDTVAGTGGQRLAGIGSRPQFGDPPGCIGITGSIPLVGVR